MAAEQHVPQRWNHKRIVVATIGWLFLLLGIAGLFLPVLQGILFLLVGLVILSKEFRWANTLLTHISSRFPKAGGSIAKAQSKAEVFQEVIRKKFSG
jgi:uncharacterized membrane protein YbaN (DUF454 family)